VYLVRRLPLHALDLVITIKEIEGEIDVRF
jgi:hypothetical protein